MKNRIKQDRLYGLKTVNSRNGSPISGNHEMDDWDRQFAESMDYYENQSSPETRDYMERVKRITSQDWDE